MPSHVPMVPQPGGIRHAADRRSHRARNAVVLAVAGVLALTGAGVAAAYVHLDRNVTVADALTLAGPAPTPSAPGTPTPTPTPVDPQAGKPVNVLLIGSDQRTGVDGVIGGTAGVVGMRSDTTIVAHLSADRTRAELVSIPRDSLVDIPSCTMTDGTKSRAQYHAMFNSAFATGWDQGGNMTSAAACTIKTVQSLTGLTIDHFVVVDFAGFQAMVDAIGGVPICIPKNYYSPDAGLRVKAGFQTLNGQTALAYARARKGTNMNGSDLQRAARQQQLIAAMIHQVLSRNVLTNVPALMSFLNAATSSLTVDPGLGHLSDMAGLALSLRGLDPSHVTFMTIPVATAPSNPNRVVWTSAATKIWANMVADQPIVSSEVATAPSPTGSPTAGPAGSPSAPSTSAPAATPSPAPTTPSNYQPGDPFNADTTLASCS